MCVCMCVCVCVYLKLRTLYFTVSISRLAELSVGGQTPPPPSSHSYHPPRTSPYHTVTPSDAYTHQFTTSPQAHYPSTPPQHSAVYGHHYTSAQNIPSHAAMSEVRSYGAQGQPGYPTGTLYILHVHCTLYIVYTVHCIHQYMCVHVYIYTCTCMHVQYIQCNCV